MGLIRDKMVEDMKLRGFPEHTQRCYVQLMMRSFLASSFARAR